MTNIHITSSTIVGDDAGALLADLGAQNLRKWGSAGLREATGTRTAYEHQTLQRLARTYEKWAVLRAMEIDLLAQRRQQLPPWRFFADWLLMRKQGRALAHVRRHLANIETIDRAIKCIPE
jgi:hypothetical protein